VLFRELGKDPFLSCAAMKHRHPGLSSDLTQVVNITVSEGETKISLAATICDIFTHLCDTVGRLEKVAAR
jgi:hypothetical protein